MILAQNWLKTAKSSWHCPFKFAFLWGRHDTFLVTFKIRTYNGSTVIWVSSKYIENPIKFVLNGSFSAFFYTSTSETPYPFMYLWHRKGTGQPQRWSRPRNDPQPWNDPQIDPEMIPTPKWSPLFILSTPKWSPRNKRMVGTHGTVDCSVIRESKAILAYNLI